MTVVCDCSLKWGDEVSLLHWGHLCWCQIHPTIDTNEIICQPWCPTVCHVCSANMIPWQLCHNHYPDYAKRNSSVSPGMPLWKRNPKQFYAINKTRMTLNVNEWNKCCIFFVSIAPKMVATFGDNGGSYPCMTMARVLSGAYRVVVRPSAHWQYQGCGGSFLMDRILVAKSFYPFGYKWGLKINMPCKLRVR